MSEQERQRLETARAGLAAYADWQRDPEAHPVTPAMLSDLARAAQWYVEEHGEQA